ncbi:MAG: hypothetical protein WKG06_31025 [Segetibacter sp.]
MYSYVMVEGSYQLPDTGYRMQDTGHQLPDTGYRMQDTGHQLPDTGYRMQDAGLQIAGCIGKLVTCDFLLVTDTYTLMAAIRKIINLFGKIKFR